MKTVLALLVLASVSHAANKELTAQEIRERLQIQTDVYILDSTGKRVVAGPVRSSISRPSREDGELKGDWSSNFGEDGTIAFKYSWKVNDKGNLQVYLEEFAEVDRDRSNPELKVSLGKKEFVVENFEPVIWKSKNTKNLNYIVRYIPSLREVSNPIDVSNLPVAGKGITVSDNTGYLWAEGVEFGGKYSGITTHRGTVALSYVPFSGAKELGVAEGDKITLNIDKKFQINLKSSSSFLPAGVVAKVYGIYNAEKRSKGFNRTHTFDTGSEERIKEVMK